MSNQYTYQVDGLDLASENALMDGRQIRHAASLAPASEYQLIHILDGSASSVGLEDKVTFAAGETARFLAFNSDRILTFTFNERGWEWGASKINEALLRELANIDEDEVLLLDGDRDKVIKPGEDINLGRAGVEHIVTERPTEITIKLNGRDRVVPHGTISFERLVEIAALIIQPGQNVYYTATYRKGPYQNPEGSMQPGEFVFIKKGMVFNVRATDKS